MRHLTRPGCCLALCLLSGIATADTVVMTWNAGSVLSTADVPPRASAFRTLADQQQPDVLLLQEVTSVAVVEAIREAMGLADYHLAVSDFVQGDDASHAALEVAIVSRFPLTGVREFDPFPDRTGDPGEPAESALVPPALPGLSITHTSRGFLVARIGALDLSVAVTHLKSSRGDTGIGDAGNANKRETTAAALAAWVVDELQARPGTTVLVGGDFNVGERDAARNGVDLQVDCFEGAACGALDRFDETHALLGEGLVQGLAMTSLSREIDRTYANWDYGSGPIDVLYVVGDGAGRFQAAVRGESAYGSDHFPVWTRILMPTPIFRSGFE